LAQWNYRILLHGGVTPLWTLKLISTIEFQQVTPPSSTHRCTPDSVIAPNLVKAHKALDVAVDAAYGRKGFKNDAERVAFLFELYQKYTSLIPATAKPKRRRR
jgi:hypothetical protein